MVPNIRNSCYVANPTVYQHLVFSSDPYFKGGGTPWVAIRSDHLSQKSDPPTTPYQIPG